MINSSEQKTERKVNWRLILKHSVIAGCILNVIFIPFYAMGLAVVYYVPGLFIIAAVAVLCKELIFVGAKKSKLLWWVFLVCALIYASYWLNIFSLIFSRFNK